MKLIAGLGAVAQGAGLGLADMRQEEDRQRRIKNEEADRAYLDEQRTQQRTQWEQANQDVERKNRLRELTSKIVNSEYQPEEIDLGVDADGNPAKGYKMGGQLFQSLQDPKAQDLLAELKSPLGQARRIAEAHMAEGDYQGAASILANATKLKADSFSLAEMERKAKYQKQQDAMHEALVGKPGSNIWQNAADIATQTNLFGLAGKTVKPEETGDGHVVYGVYDPGGLDGKETRIGQLGKYPNTAAGRLRLMADFRTGSPEQMAAWAKENEDRDLKLRKDEREGEKHKSDMEVNAALARYRDASAQALLEKDKSGGLKNDPMYNLPAGVKTEVQSLGEQIKTYQQAIANAVAKGEANPESIKQLEGKVAALTMRRNKMLAPYTNTSGEQGADPLGLRGGEKSGGGRINTTPSTGAGKKPTIVERVRASTIGLGTPEYVPPADSPAGRFKASQAARAGLEAGRRESARSTTREAAIAALKAGDVQAAAMVQDMDGFGLLDSAMKSAIFSLVNSRQTSAIGLE